MKQDYRNVAYDAEKPIYGTIGGRNNERSIMGNKRTAAQVADIIERFLNSNSLYPQEWNDFVECSEPNVRLDSYRKKCDELDPLVNCPDPQDPKAIEELRNMVDELRRLEDLN